MFIGKKITLFTMTLLGLFNATHSYAALNGAYLGLQLGWGEVHSAGISISDANALLDNTIGANNYVITSFSSDATDNGLAGRVFAGYQITCNWAVEIGWVKFTKLPVKATINAVQIAPYAPIVSSIVPGEIKTDAFDLNIKGILPLPYHFNVYGKLGYAYIEAWSQETLTTSALGVVNTTTYKDTKHRYYPEFSIGASYNLRPDFTADLSYTRIQKTGGYDPIGSTDLVALGIIWSFGTI